MNDQETRRRTTYTAALFGAITALAIVVTLGLPLQAQTFTVLHSFNGPPSDGGVPWAGLTIDGAGRLYGTSTQGGSA